MQDPALRERRQVACLLFSLAFGSSEGTWECHLLPMLPGSRDPLHGFSVTMPPPACGAGGPEGSAVSMGTAAEVKCRWDTSFTHHWARGQLFHVKKAWGTSRDAPVLAFCRATLVLRAGVRSKLQQAGFKFRGIKWSLLALPCTPWWCFPEPSVTEEQKLDPASCLVLPSTSAKQAFWAGCPCSTMKIITADLLSSDASEPNSFHLNVKQICQCAGVMNAQSLCPFCAFVVNCLLESPALGKNQEGRGGSHNFKKQVSLDLT